MDPAYSADKIAPSTFQHILNQYSEVVPEGLHELETKRLDVIPAILASRRDDGDAYLTQEEVLALVEWKL